MATLHTIEVARKEIAKIYIAAFNRVPDAGGLSNWMNQYMAELMTYEQIAADFANQPEYTAKYPSIMTDSEYITQIYLNVFGRNPDEGGKQNWINQIANPAVSGITRGSVMQEMLKSASVDGNSDGVRLANQAKFAVQSILDGVPTATATAQLANITADDATVTAATTAVSGSAGNVLGQTIAMVKGLDNVIGTANNDFILGSVDSTAGSELQTFSAIDIINGNGGIDTLKISAATALTTANLANISNIEVITLDAASTVGATTAAAAFSTAGLTGVTTLNVIRATDAFVKAAATTDVNVSGATGKVEVFDGKTVTVASKLDVATDYITVDGAKDVTVTATGVTNAAGITIGGTTAVTGAVTVTSTGAALVGNDGAVTLDAIAVTGGTTVNITQVAAASYGDAASKNAGANDIVTQGNITVTAKSATTAVTIKQDAAVAAKNAAATTGGVTETASVKFGALKANDTLTIDTNANGSLDAGELTLTAKVDMTAAEVAAAFANLVKDAAKGTLLAGDTQSAAASTKGTYTGNEAAWTSAAASGDTVVFTSNTAKTSVTDLSFVLVGTGTAPIVTKTEGKANDATLTGGVTGIVAGDVVIAADAALTTVTVNGYDNSGANASKITGAAAALATINLSNGTAFLVSDTASTVALNLEKVTGAVTFTAQPATLNVKSIGDNTSGIVSSAVTTAFNVSGTGTLNATSANLAAVKNITVTETAGLNLTSATLAALESVTTTGTTGAVTMSILGAQTTYTGGAGVDTVTVSDAGTAVAKAIDLGAGNDKLILTGALVLDPAVEIKGGEGTDTLSSDAASLVARSGGTTFATKLNSFERLEITGATGAQAINVANLGFASYVTVAGVANTGADVLTLNNLANNATVIVNAAVGGAAGGADGITTVIKDAADATLGTADVLNFEITNASGIAAATLTAADIETVNLTVTDTATATIDTHTLTFAADKATTLDIGGNAGLTLTLSGAVKLETINASDMTAGGLTVTANGSNVMTITGGAGADVLTASATKADIINGGAGNDTITAGFNGAKLTGGLGNDLFVVGATSATGNVQANTYSYIEDFQAGDKIQLAYWENDTAAGGAAASTDLVDKITKLAATLDASTSVFNDYVVAAFKEMTTIGDAVWFSFGGDSYIVIDSNEDAGVGGYVAQQTGLVAGEDLIVRIENVDLTGMSFNSTYGTIEIA